MIKIKPMQTFLERLRARVRAAIERLSPNEPLRVAVIGGGVAGTEILLGLPAFLDTMSVQNYELRLITRSEEVLAESRGAGRRVKDELLRRGNLLTVGKSVLRINDHSITLDDGTTITADIVVWATGASPAPLLSQLGLPLDDRGFLATDTTLRSTSGEPIFAVGDTGSIVGEAVPKAGVHAVRQGPVLWTNLQRSLDGQSLQHYHPQRTFLKLINLGNGRAVGVWRGLSFSGRWVMRWKNSIDQNFMAKYQPVRMSAEGQTMQCHGCGCKLGSQTLESALQVAPGHAIAIEDATEIGCDAEGRQLVASTDFFSCPLDDAYLNGRVAALHAASDIIAAGAQPTKALANVVLLDGDAKSQERSLSDFLSGARFEFDALGAEIVGGHTIVGPRMEVGFSVIGHALSERLLRKANLQPEDELWLTKPLGIGVLLAAHMRSRCSAANYERLLETMFARQHHYAVLAIESGVVAATDITGFGLCGHLLEMLSASNVAAKICLDDVPVLPGALAAVANGIESSLIDDNFAADHRIDASANVRALPKYRLLFDPQTCGGLLFGCSPESGKQLGERCADAGLNPPHRIGQVFARQASERLLQIDMDRS
ncbi:MAG: selenide, water dikinase SelD [Pirellulaceae bacterium]